MIEVVAVLTSLLGSLGALALLLAGSRSLDDASTDDQERVMRRARRVLVPLIIASVVGTMAAFALITALTGIQAASGKGFAVFLGVMATALIPLFVMAAKFGRRYRDAGSVG